MAIQPVQPGAAPANPCTRAQAAEFLANFQTATGCTPFGTDAAMCILNDLYGLTHILAISFEEAALKPASNEVLYRAINPRPLADGYRSIQSLVALAAFFAEAQS